MNGKYMSSILGIKNAIDKQKLAVKAQDLVLFGPPKRTSNPCVPCSSARLNVHPTHVFMLFGPPKRTCTSNHVFVLSPTCNKIAQVNIAFLTAAAGATCRITLWLLSVSISVIIALSSVAGELVVWAAL